MKKKGIGGKGFTLIELLVVVAIIGILMAVIILFVNTSRAKAQDSKTKQVLSSVRSSANEEKTDTGTFSDICTNGKSYGVISTLAEQYNLTYEEYKCYAGNNDFVIAFPLKAEEGYWCIDANNTARQVSALPAGTAPYSCDNLAGGGSGNPQQPAMATLNFGDNTTGSDFEIELLDPNTWQSYWGYTWNGSSMQVPPGTYHMEIYPIVMKQYSYSLSCSYTNAFANEYEGGFQGIDLTSTCSLSMHP